MQGETFERMASIWGKVIEVEDATTQRLQTHIGRVCILTNHAENIDSIIELCVDDYTYKIHVFEDTTIAAVIGQRYLTPATFSESDSNSGSLSLEEGEWNPGSNSDASEFITDSADSGNQSSELIGQDNSVLGLSGSGSGSGSKNSAERRDRDNAVDLAFGENLPKSSSTFMANTVTCQKSMCPSPASFVQETAEDSFGLNQNFSSLGLHQSKPTSEQADDLGLHGKPLLISGKQQSSRALNPGPNEGSLNSPLNKSPLKSPREHSPSEPVSTPTHPVCSSKPAPLIMQNKEERRRKGK